MEEQFHLPRPRVRWGFGKMGTILTLVMLLCLCLTTNSHEAARIIEQQQQQEEEQEEAERQGFSSKPNWNNNNNRRVIDVKGGPESVVWVVQLSDLHFSVHNPDRALDFNTIVGPALSMINPSLVLVTGDLTGFHHALFSHSFLI